MQIRFKKTEWLQYSSSIIIISFIVYLNLPIGLMGRVFVHGLGDQGSVSGQVIPKTQKIVLDISLLNTQVHFKGKAEQSRERRSALPNTSV